jgi:hypothetical protein
MFNVKNETARLERGGPFLFLRLAALSAATSFVANFLSATT